MLKPGDKVKVMTKKKTEEGTLMPSPQKEVVLVKLGSGYNVGFLKKEVTKMVEVSKAVKLPTKSALAETPRPGLPTLAVLHTGGTIASKADYRTGGVAAEFSPKELLALFPELKDIANIHSELIAQMWSDDLRFKHFAVIAKKIEEQVKAGVKGIIIGIGTDNLAVAAAALAFIIEKTPVPIIVVGAQRSSDRGSSDAAMNLICAAEFAVKTDFGGVAICLHGKADDEYCSILPATKTYKLHSSRRDAFKAINAEPLARVGYKDRKIIFSSKDYPRREPSIVIKPLMEEKVGLLKIHVNMFPEQFAFFKRYKGLIIEGTGLGHTPGQAPNPECAIHKKMYPAIKRVIDSGCIVVMTTQCLFGGVNLNVYDKGRDLLHLGIIPGKDMLGNTALVKLSWLLANYPKEKVKRLMTQNLRGEINERLKYEGDFLG
ncbi:Glu-tRNA(Gln) amidotransferase subunit GatD [Candidatus Woesearchaeota archaeon]|nr:Glu-tRNA(Gln) amidotransferase subunit GatD [Candidatus Woesearchaeota archaeon]